MPCRPETPFAVVFLPACGSGVKTRILELAGGNIERVEAKTVFAAAREQDVAALDLVRRAGEYIGIGIASYINLLDPEKIVLAGGYFCFKVCPSALTS